MTIRSINALVIEDHDFQRQSLCLMLKNIGLSTVLEARDGLSALQKITQTSGAFDVIFCDLRMPGMDGVEFIRKLGESDSKAQLILVSGQDRAIIDSVQRMAAAYDVDVLGHVGKPPKKEWVKKLLKRHVLMSHEKGAGRPDPGYIPEIGPEEIRAAMDAGEIIPYYQPLVDVQAGRIIAVEALARWERKTGEVIPAGAFIPVAEQSGLITELTMQIADAALADMKHLSETVPGLLLSLNLSFASLDDVGLPERLSEMAAAKGVPADRIILEMTESCISANFAKTLDVLSRFRLRGFRLSLDDFGTGFSTLGQLSQIPFNEIKIDKSLVTDAYKLPHKRMILESCIALAKRLKLRTVTEGVENVMDWDMVNKLGADLAQGFLVTPPVRVEAFCSAIRQWRGPVAAPSETCRQTVGNAM